MSEKDNKVRRQWLIVVFLSLLIAAFNAVMRFRYDHSLDFFPLARYGFAFFSMAGALAFAYSAYYCAYKKPGTKLLVFCLLITTLSFISTLIFYLQGKLHPPAYIPYYGTYAITTQGLGLWWMILCLKMRKINKRLQALSTPST